MTPNAGIDRLDGVVDGVLRARVAARPIDGAANSRLIDVLAHELGIARSRVSVVRGEKSRVKVLELDGVAPELVRSQWPGVDV